MMQSIFLIVKNIPQETIKEVMDDDQLGQIFLNDTEKTEKKAQYTTNCYYVANFLKAYKTQQELTKNRFLFDLHAKFNPYKSVEKQLEQLPELRQDK